MLYIVAREPREESTFQWHVGEKVNGNLIAKIETGTFRVVEIQADGHELQYIRDNFRNLPDCPYLKLVTWKGNWAQFIFDHLPRETKTHHRSEKDTD